MRPGRKPLKHIENMKTLIKISWRNIWRNRSRSLIIIVAIVLGLMGGVFSAAVRLGTEQQQYTEAIENQISHIQIHHPEFIANPEAGYSIPDGLSMADKLAGHPKIRTASARTLLDGMVASANMTAGVRIKGVNPEREAQTTSLDQLITEGTYFEDNGRLPSVIIGERLAENLNVGIGSRIVLTFQDISGEIVSASFRVEGLFAVSSTRFMERNVFVRSEALTHFAGADELVTEIAVLLYNSDDYRLMKEELQAYYPDTEVRHWADLMPSLYFSLEFLDQSLIWLVGIIVLGVSFGLLNTILMSVLERVREFGVLMAIGMKKARVFTMVVMETTMVSLIGGLIGLSLSWIMVEWLNKRGLDLSGVGGEGMGEFGYASVIYPNIDPGFFLEIMVVVLAFAILAAIYPAWKAIRLVPAEAVRTE
jgi:putative ABC transport system permease protein